ncbi:MAG: ABC transporter permease [Oscillospiraceae bacterium]|nr:ABC transporter permease [Oscillospiraceae bacterium]
MNILTSYTLRCLKQNRVRTLVTVIGIILSVTLFTAVAEGIWSGWRYLIRATEAEKGRYHAVVRELTEDEYAGLAREPEVAEIGRLETLGWAVIAQGDLNWPYLRVASYDFSCDLLSVRMIAGRYPQNDHELIVSNQMPSLSRVSYAVGQTVSLELGQRVAEDGSPLPIYSSYLSAGVERLRDTVSHEYTVVGVYHSMGGAFADYDSPGTLALTTGAAGVSTEAVVRLRDVRDTLAFCDAHFDLGEGCVGNEKLLQISGVVDEENLRLVVAGLLAILFGLIAFGSVCLIYNAFSISVSERTKQFGLLKSVGATNRQLRRAVLTEALLLCAVAIPIGLLLGCGGIALALRLLRPAFDSLMRVGDRPPESIRLELNPPVLLLAVGIGLVTALISAWIPSKRATRLSPIAAIRQSADVRIRASKLRVNPLTRKLFGFPGLLAAKNFKRSRKQYRATVVSLFLSVVLFISAFCFSSYLRNEIARSIAQHAADVSIYSEKLSSVEDPDALLRELRAVEGVTAAGYRINGSDMLPDMPTLTLPQDALAPDADFEKLAMPGMELDQPFLYGFVDDEYYKTLCAEAGMDPTLGQGIAYNHGQQWEYDDNGKNAHMHSWTVLRPEALPVEAEAMMVPNWIDGCQLIYSEGDGEGNVTKYVYQAPWNPERDEAPRELSLSPEEAEVHWHFTIGGVLDRQPIVVNGISFTVLFPVSRYEAVTGTALEPEQDLSIQFHFCTEDHARVAEAFRKLLDEKHPELSGIVTVRDNRAGNQSEQASLLILNVFSFGFIILISLISAANVFNTISTNVSLRRREFATLKSVGMGNRTFGRMMRFECLLYGAKSLLWGLPVSVGISWLIWRVVDQGFVSGSYRPPWAAMGIAAGSVFLVVFVTMLYATGKIRKDNPIDALKTETL